LIIRSFKHSIIRKFDLFLYSNSVNLKANLELSANAMLAVEVNSGGPDSLAGQQ
jgi:hypothetical protein